MKNTVLVLGVALSLAAFQARAEMAIEDTDGNGSYSMEEMQAAVADLSAETFAEIDADANGEVSADELAAAVEAGVIEG